MMGGTPIASKDELTVHNIHWHGRDWARYGRIHSSIQEADTPIHAGLRERRLTNLCSVHICRLLCPELGL